jgi:hypothetical protein
VVSSSPERRLRVIRKFRLNVLYQKLAETIHAPAEVEKNINIVAGANAIQLQLTGAQHELMLF